MDSKTYRIKNICKIIVRVKKLGKALQLYKNVLGLEEINRFNNTVTLKINNHVNLEVVKVREDEFIKTSIELEVEQLKELYNRLINCNLPYTGQLSLSPDWKYLTCTVSDYDGNLLRFSEIFVPKKETKPSFYSLPLAENKTVFSLIIPTKRSNDHLEKLLNSIKNTCSDPKNIEIILIVDKEDELEKSAVLLNFPELNIILKSREYSDNLNEDYYNWGGRQSLGKYIWILGDDCLLVQRNWDKILEGKIEEYLKDKPDRLLLVSALDNTPPPPAFPTNFPCFPMVTRESFNFFGYIVPPLIKTWGADIALYELYRGIDRVLEVKDYLFVEHLSHHTNSCPQDEINKKVEKIFKGNQEDLYYTRRQLVPKEIEKAKKYILSFKEK